MVKNDCVTFIYIFSSYIIYISLILLNRTQYFSPEENQLFSNIRICISQVSRADSKSLWAMISLQGGKCQLRLDRYCTHLVTGKASGVKYETAMRHHIHIVTPDWIIECCKKGAVISEVEYHPRLLVYPSPNSSTAMITGFMDEDPDNSTAQEEQVRTKAMLEQLKQRMPWNQPSPPVSSNVAHNISATNTTNVPYSATGQNTVNIQPQQQQHLPRPISSTGLNTSTIAPVASDQNVINQATGWLPQSSQQNNIPQMKVIPSQMQQQELSTQQINIQHQLIQHQQLTSQQQQLTQQQQITQHQQQLQQQSYNQQQLLNQQTSPQIPSQQQQLIGQQQSLGQQTLVAQQQINSQLPQHQLTSQQQQLLTSQQKQLNQHQIIHQQMNQQQLAQHQQQQQQVQLAAQQQQIVLQQQQLSSQPQQIASQHQLTQQASPQQLTPEQRQLILLQQQQQQQKIQQISQQLQQSAPQSSQQFVIREGQLQQQPQNQLIGPNQQGFIVQRDSQWQQQQYLQLQRQQQQIGPQRPGGQWPALRTIREDQPQPPQQPRQLIQLDAQTHQQLQQMDPLQRAQFIQKIQKQKNLILQRQMQNRQAQGPHIAVIRNPVSTGKPVQPGSLQWVQQARPQMMGPQIAQPSSQKPVHPGVQPPALAPINSSNQVIVPAGQNIQSPQAGQTFQQGQPLTPQQILQMQKHQMARLHFQQLQQQPQSTQQEPPLTSLSSNAQIPPDQQLVVNAKTKTALANMLTNRLQGGATEGSAAGQLRLMTAQHRAPPPPSQDPQLLAAYQRRTAGNITNGAPSGAPMKMQYGSAAPQPKAQFYGHNPNLKRMNLSHLCLIVQM